MIELKDGMSLKDFKTYCEKADCNLVTKWNYKKFSILCKECGSYNVQVVDDLEYHEGSSCPTCGFDSYTTGKIIIKCLNCGTGMQVLDSEKLNN